MRLRATLLAALIPACIESTAVVCEDGSVCPAGTTCDVERHLCIDEAQRAACNGKADGDDCSYADTAGACSMGLCATSTCGDRLIGPGEACDDGNFISGDGCRSDCRSTEVCGNGTIDFEAGELCDCGDQEAAVGCASVNSVDAPDATCLPDCTLRCGDGVIETGEVCDGSPPPGESCLDYGFDEGLIGCSSICTPALATCKQFGWVSVDTAVADPRLRGIWGVASDAVFAVGDAGLVLRWDGAAWIRQPVPATVAAASFRAVWGRSASDVYAVGLGGASIHFDGTSWTQFAAGASDLFTVTGDATHVIAAGGDMGVATVVESENAGAFTFFSQTSLGTLHGVAVQGSNVIAVGDNATFCRRPLATAGAWTCSQHASGTDFTSVVAIGAALWVGADPGLYFGSSPATASDLSPLAAIVGSVTSLAAIGPDVIVGSDRIYRVGPDGRFQISDAPVPNDALWGAAIDDIWGVGRGARHFGGTTWAAAPLDAPSGLQAIDAGPAGVFTVGLQSTAAKFDDGTWTSLSMLPNLQLVGVSSGSDAVVLLQSNGNILRSLASPYTSFTQQAMGSSLNYVDILTFDQAHDTFALTRSATESHVYRTNTVSGTFWTETSPGLPVNVLMNALWGTADDDLYVAGNGGLAYHWNGSSWTQLSTGVSLELRDVRGTSPTDIWFVGELGAILHYDGTSVTAFDSGTSATLESVWPLGPSDVFATGGDTLLHYDGTQWVPVRDATLDYVTDLAGTGPYLFGIGSAGGTELLIRY